MTFSLMCNITWDANGTRHVCRWPVLPVEWQKMDLHDMPMDAWNGSE